MRAALKSVLLGGVAIMLATPAMAVSVDGKLDTNEYANGYLLSLSEDGSDGMTTSELWFEDTGFVNDGGGSDIGSVSIYVKFDTSFVDTTYGDKGTHLSPGWGSQGHSFGDLRGSDKLIVGFYTDPNDTNSEKEAKLDFIHSDGTTGGVADGEGDERDFNLADFIEVGTSLDFNINNLAGYVEANAPGGFDWEVNSPDHNDHASLDDPDTVTDEDDFLNALENLNWLPYVGYEFRISRTALGLGSSDTMTISRFASNWEIHASPKKDGFNNSRKCFDINGGQSDLEACATPIDTPSGPPGVAEPGTLVLMTTALVGAIGLRRRRRKG